MKKQYAIVGSWEGEHNKGFHTFEYNPETLEFNEKENYHPFMNVGCTPLISSNKVMYALNETLQDKQYGGSLYAFKVDPINKTLEEINSASTISVNPCFLALSEDEKYALVVHHTSSQNQIAVFEKDLFGKMSSWLKHDDALVVLYEIKEDGSIGDILDVHNPQKEFNAQTQRKHSKLHSIYLDKKTGIYFVFDKGLDKVYTYKIKNNKLKYLHHVDVNTGDKPRYGVVHPTKNILYGTNEGYKYVYVYSYFKDGHIYKSNEVCLSDKDNKDCLASDIQKHPDKDILYVTLRGIDDVFVLDISDANNPVKVQEISCYGKHPKAITISKDGKYAFICNMHSNSISIFSIAEDGTLTFIKDKEVYKASSIVFVEEDE